MAKEIWIVDANKIAKLRKEQRLSQEKLAEVAPVSKNTLQTIEQKGYGTKQAVVGVAATLDCNPDDIVRVKLRSWDWVPPDLSEAKKKKFQTAACRDMDGDYDQAIALSADVLQQTRKEYDSLQKESLDSPVSMQNKKLNKFRQCFVEVLVKHIAYLSNGGKDKEALKLCLEFTGADCQTQISLQDLAWLNYHKGIAQRRLGDLDKALETFEPIWAQGSFGHKNGAAHQIGVVYLQQYKANPDNEVYAAKAKQYFQESINSWNNVGLIRESGSGRNALLHRKGFTLCRLADLAIMQKVYEKARMYLGEALIIFGQHDCDRYAKVALDKLISMKV